MSAKRGGVLVHLTVDEPLPLEVPAGNSVALTVRVSCDDQRDRTGLTVAVTAPDGQATSHALTADADGTSAMAVVALKPPSRVGEHVFRLTMPPHEIAGTQYCEAALDVPVRVIPQATSLAVWDVPLSVTTGASFAVKAGAKSAADAPLAGCTIELLDEAGEVAGRGTLGDVPLAGTGALYWTEIQLQAPPQEGLITWSVRFGASDLDVPHDVSNTSFSIAVARPPEHVLSVKVIEHATSVPIPDVELRLGAYRGTTGELGLATIAIPKGRYELRVWKAGFEAPPRPLDIDGDAFVEIEALVVPEEDPDARWRM